MSNMSYCRFQNTLGDLRDCESALQNEGLDGLSDDERDAAFELIKICGDIFEAFADENPNDYEDENGI